MLYHDPGATLDDLREAVDTLEEIERTARRVLGGAHSLTVDIEGDLRDARAVLHFVLRACSSLRVLVLLLWLNLLFFPEWLAGCRGGWSRRPASEASDGIVSNCKM